MECRNQVMPMMLSSGMGRTLAAETAQRGGRCLPMAADTQDSAAAERLVQLALPAHARIPHTP